MYITLRKQLPQWQWLFLIALPAALLTACPASNPARVNTNLADTTLPNPVSIKGHMTGAAGDSSAGAFSPGTPPPFVILNSTAGQLEITVTASDAESGIAKLEIFTNDRMCNFKNGTWGGGNLPTNFRTKIVNTPDASGTLPVKSVALANIQTTTERGNFDKRTWQIFGVATNSAGKFVNIGPLFYTAVSANVLAANRGDGCP
jgi:hypothetical protein